MRSFLSNFMEAAEIDKIEAAYKVKHPDASGLPAYIPKSRLDEEIAKRKTAEEAIKTATKPFEDKLKAIPEDWQKQINDAKAALETQKADYEKKIQDAQKSADVTAKIYESGARNVKAVRALLDESKGIDEQLTALKKSDSYLFNLGNDGSKGTGKQSDGGDPEGGSKGLSDDAMYRAVGLTPPAHT